MLHGTRSSCTVYQRYTCLSWTAVGSTGSGGMALKNDNTLWTWGTNLYGVGDNSGINRSSPVQIGGSTWTNTVLSGGYAVFVITRQ